VNESDVKDLKPVGVLGIKYFDQIYSLSDVGFEQVSTYAGAIKMLQAGRADYLASLKHQNTELAAKRLGVSLKACLTRPMLSLDGFFYLHEKHQNLIPQLESILSTLVET